MGKRVLHLRDERKMVIDSVTALSSWLGRLKEGVFPSQQALYSVKRVTRSRQGDVLGEAVLQAAHDIGHSILV